MGIFTGATIFTLAFVSDVLLPARAILLTDPHNDGGGTCSSPADCWWNGVCTNSACVCNAAWTGDVCNQLAEGDSVQLWPNPAEGLPPNDFVTDSWGATVQQDNASGEWWMYVCVACVFSNGNPQPFSMHNSGIVAAKAPALEGPYSFVGQFTGIFSEGPHMARGPGGEAAFLLITPGGSNASTPVSCTGAYPTSVSSIAMPPGSTVTKNIWSSPSPAGPWTPHNMTVNETGDLTYFSNPVRLAVLPVPYSHALYRADPLLCPQPQSIAFDNATGEGLLAWRVNLVPPFGKGETLGFARGPSFSGPFTTLAEPLMPGLVGYEDPFLWRHTEATATGWESILSIIEHTQTGTSGVGGLFVSADGGHTWRKSPVPAYTLAVRMTGVGWNSTTNVTQVRLLYFLGDPLHEGSPRSCLSHRPAQFLRRERPELLFDAVTGAPTHLLTGAMLGGRGPNGDWQLSFSIATRIGKN